MFIFFSTLCDSTCNACNATEGCVSCKGNLVNTSTN